MDNFTTLYNRLLNRCPNVGVVLSQQLINDSWRTLQARREWSFRRRFGTFAPPTQVVNGSASTNVNTAAANPFLITGLNTTWTQDMVGRQIRIGGLLYPFYTINGVISPTSLLIDQPWAGDDVINQSYQIIKAYYVVPDDFGYFYAIVSIKDGYRLYTNLTESDLAMLDPQRTNFGQTYAVVFRGYTSNIQGKIGPCIPNPMTTPVDHFTGPVTTTTNGFSYPGPLTYFISVTGPGTFTWARAGSSSVNALSITTDPQDLEFGIQVYWPANGGDVSAGFQYTFTCLPGDSVSGAPFYELWPAPTFSAYLYPYIYIAKEYDLTVASPQLPPFIANRGEVILEMALEKCAEFPGADVDHPNPYHDLRQAAYHAGKVKDMLIDLERNDEEVGVSLIDYQIYPYAPSPWLDGQWQQSHAPYLNS